jgi:hypothetical protein
MTGGQVIEVDNFTVLTVSSLLRIFISPVFLYFPKPGVCAGPGLITQTAFGFVPCQLIAINRHIGIFRKILFCKV